MERIKKGAELAAWRHGYQAGELTVASPCPYRRDQFSRWLGEKAIEKRVRNSSQLNPQGGWVTMTKAKLRARTCANQRQWVRARSCPLGCSEAGDARPTVDLRSSVACFFLWAKAEGTRRRWPRRRTYFG